MIVSGLGLKGVNMKLRKIIITIEALTDINLKDFNKESMNDLFILYFVKAYEEITIHQVHTQVVKEGK